jgi:hypothetical protein
MEISKMDFNRIVSELDAEIARLQHIRSALTAGAGTSTATSSVAPTALAKKSGRGRPKGSKNAPKPGAVKAAQVAAPKPVAAKAAKSAGKRKLSPEGRKRIADAMKRRWAERRKETAKK